MFAVSYHSGRIVYFLGLHSLANHLALADVLAIHRVSLLEV